ncbi:hypothetical protein SELR_pSRC300050 (plasmid) [Selenomonas ruminantium subsp. lactilytica TAM6421]|uniref:Uncharacterized protein n=1 Tax=Selenomonas ruminantium subsp. lactilytica (strain NBRC 103574 / TAM6421) TaxID=927704 RepID=I0GWE1_SELRL|nr:hypothetical protein [Selenomonas ruminantium]BAL85078.1 hypothetical protein SELR_pSRC300050 [Selenomonas ruminantium subsp. lactilytica TAM6421]
MKLSIKYEVEINEHFDNEADKEIIEGFVRAKEDETLPGILKETMEDNLTGGDTPDERVKVTVADYTLDLEA